MKTPIYVKKAQLNWRIRKKKEGYKWYNFFTTPEVGDKLREFYKQLKHEK
jgi:hypothetical protein